LVYYDHTTERRLRRGNGETMENRTLTIAMPGRSPGARVGAVVAAVALVFAALVLVQQPADAAPAGAPVAAAVAAPVGNGLTAQIDVRQFVCPILLSIRAAFAGSPFFGFIAAALDPIIAGFGCAPSPG
jgi:hypothetical protein